MILALLAATGAALGYGISTIMQALAARRSSGLTLLHQPVVLAALTLDGLAFLLSLLALDTLPLFVVQAIQASSLVVVVVLARVYLHATIRRRDTAAVAGVVLALVVIAAGSGEQPAKEPQHSFVVAMLVGTVVLLAALAFSYRGGNRVVLTVLAGLGYSGAALAARGAHGAGTLLETISQPLVLAILGCGAVGVLGYLRALESGRVGSVAAALSVIEVVVPGVVGFLVLGDTIRHGWAVPVLLAITVALIGCAVLATSPANEAAEAPDPSPPVPDPSR